MTPSHMSQADYDWIIDVIRRFGLAGRDVLTDWEIEFMEDWDYKVQRYGDRMFPPSDKQRAVLVRIDDKLKEVD